MEHVENTVESDKILDNIVCISKEMENGNILLIPRDIMKFILDLLLNHMTYNNFKWIERVSLSWFKYLNSKKIYMYSRLNYKTNLMNPITITTNKKAKLQNDCCSIYLDFYPNVNKNREQNNKRRLIKFFRKEYHNFPPELPQALANKFDHDITDLKFSQCIYSSIKNTANLYTKYDVTQDSVNAIINKIKGKFRFTINGQMLDPVITPDFSKSRKLCILTYCYDKAQSDFFSIFEAPRATGKIDKSRYPNHFVIFDELYKDKLYKDSNKELLETFINTKNASDDSDSESSDSESSNFDDDRLDDVSFNEQLREFIGNGNSDSNSVDDPYFDNYTHGII